MQPTRRIIALIALLLIGAGSMLPAAAQPSGQMRKEFEGVGIDEKLSASIPLDLTFHNAAGDPVTLGEYFDGERPVMLTLNYYDCPMLCPLVLDRYAHTLRNIAWTPGEEFEAITVSIDPTETPAMARRQKEGFVAALNKPGAGKGWHFLTGRQASIQALADAVGFNYRKVEGKDEYAHPTAVIFLSGEGKVTRYIYGMNIPPADARQALVEASDGKVGTVMDQITLYCFQFDPKANSYTADAFALMRIGGILVAVMLGAALVYLWRRERTDVERDQYDKRMEEGLDDYLTT